MTFGQRFKSLRLEKGLTQKEIAEDFDKKYNYSFNKSSISQYENGLRKPELSALNDWASYFNVTVDYLLGNTDRKEIELITRNVDGYEAIIHKARESNLPDEALKELDDYIRFLIHKHKINKR